FILIAGDLFNTSLPPMDSLKLAVEQLKLLKDNNIPVYIIPGSHDFSPSGKTMLDVLESAGLMVNVAKGEDADGKLRLRFTVDKKTGAKITGLLGKRGGLEKSYYESLLLEELEKEKGCKIFMFHSLLAELKTKAFEHIEGIPISLLPKGFDYYAGGHIHIVKSEVIEGYGRVAYSGPLFPNSFAELEELGAGGFFIIEDGKSTRETVQAYNVNALTFDAGNKTPVQVTQEIMERISRQEFVNTIITLRVEGTLSSGKSSEIGFKDIFEKLYARGAFMVMKNTLGLKSREFEEIKVEAKPAEDVEDQLMREHLGQIKLDGKKPEQELQLIKELMHALNAEKGEGEKSYDFEQKVRERVRSIIGL
ncbi:metallophosphoesterase, partial [Candidatus Woesearchaeota archaeon]|nr:metallophosphoesterase [Candidatus Woesearchaeota archaeon]